MQPTSASAEQQIDNLVQNWDQLPDLDRALKIAEIKRSGLSQREIARRIHCSEASVRRLLAILRAPAADIAAARKGQISTNKLLRNAKAARRRQAEAEQAHAQRERKLQSAEGAALICHWLGQQNLAGPDGERIIEQVRQKFMLADRLHIPPPTIKIPARLSSAELIALCRPKTPIPDNAENINWYAQWLLWWVMYVFAHPDVRDQALDLALQRQWK